MLNICQARSFGKLNSTQSPRQLSTCSCQAQLSLQAIQRKLLPTPRASVVQQQNRMQDRDLQRLRVRPAFQTA